MVRKAYSIVTLLEEINTARPGRYTASDGWLGDPAHASRKSDHNPNAAGVVRAVDITNDPDDHDGDPTDDLPGQWLANQLAARLGKHPALGSGAYVIFNGQIISTDRLDEGWRPYDGPNAHKTHVHLSVATRAAGFDSRTPFHLFTNEEDLMVTKEDEAKIRAIVADEAAKATRAELARLFRDEAGDGVDIGRARVISRDGSKVYTVADLLFAAAGIDNDG